MRATSRLPRLTVALFSWTLIAGASAALAQSPSRPALIDPDVVPDDMLTLVVATHFVTPSANAISPRAEFTNARIPLSAFNETDHCVDQQALAAAKEYFTTLGRVLGKAGHYYFVPEAEIEKSVSMCEKMHGRPPQAWVDKKTKVIAFGKVVPIADAPTLERSVR
jgi:hypothetical protein